MTHCLGPLLSPLLPSFEASLSPWPLSGSLWQPLGELGTLVPQVSHILLCSPVPAAEEQLSPVSGPEKTQVTQKKCEFLNYSHKMWRGEQRYNCARSALDTTVFNSPSLLPRGVASLEWHSWSLSDTDVPISNSSDKKALICLAPVGA